MEKQQRTPIATIPCDKAVTGIARGRVLHLRREGSGNKGGDYFKILQTAGEGGSCVCYDATMLGERKTGRLKEFYPIAEVMPYTLVRSEKNYVAATEESKANFALARDEFVESYHLLREIMEKKKKASDFCNFIPDFSIYYACDEEGNFIDGSTAYIWTAPENLTVFEEYIEDVRKHPNVKPVHKLLTILKTVLTLTECIKIFHENGLLHLDIKPSNFGIPQRKGRLLTDSITMFDVNTIYSLRDGQTKEYGTEGFAAPELVSRGADHRSDIYSIGCTLFSAIVVNDEIEEMGFSNRYYPRLSKLIDTSELIRASETNANIFLKSELVSILKKCLASSPHMRYQSCTELAEDLEHALVHLYPAEINTRLPIDKQLVVMANELDKKGRVDSYLAFLYHLYKNPLFEFIEKDSTRIDVLIVGFGNYGQKFLDCCLQVGQILGKQLNIKVVSNNRIKGKPDKAFYLSGRPALANFFSIDGSDCEDPYGSIVFENREFVREDFKKNRAIAREIANENNQGRYVFIALGDDVLNRGVAQAMVDAAKGVYPCSVNFAVEGAHIQGKVYGNPIYVSDRIEDEPLYREIERMAFNVHLLWEGGLDSDLKKEKAKFKEDRYYYSSSVANVISIKYKLHSFGIDEDDLVACAHRFYEEVVKDHSKKQAVMAMLEHKRWICEKICDGWECNTDLESCISGPINDKKRKKHVCLVRGGEYAALRTKAWTTAKWDNATEEDLASLDELDRVSVRLHQIMKREADRIRRESTLLDSTMLQLKEITKQNAEVSIAFSEWYSCLSLLWNGHAKAPEKIEKGKKAVMNAMRRSAKHENMRAVDEYEKMMKVLLNSVSVLSAEDANVAKALIELIDRRFRVILRSMRYVDYKKYDTDLVNYIPFILTYRDDIHLLIPFSCGTNTQRFMNVAAPTVSNPSLVTYLYHFTQPQEIETFKRAVKYVLNYMDEKMLAVKLNFLITHRSGDDLASMLSSMKNELLEAGQSRIRKIAFIGVENEFGIANAISEELAPYTVDAVELNATSLSYLLVGAGFYSKYPSYRFDLNTKKFRETNGCDFLLYIKSKQYLKVSDMFASQNSKGYLESPEGFHNDYAKLWEIYCRDEAAWKSTCELLKRYMQTRDLMFEAEVGSVGKAALQKKRWIIPFLAFAGAKKIIDGLIAEGVMDSQSEIVYRSVDSCEMTVIASESVLRELEGMLVNPYMLCRPDDIQLRTERNRVKVTFERTDVERLDLREVRENKAAVEETSRIRAVLKALADVAYLNNYKVSAENADIVSFSFATPRIKGLLTKEGDILEVYIYHKCLSSGLFDDIATGYEVNWDGTDVKSEFDIILTKGFRGLLIETKATSRIEQNYYFKLSCLAQKFGTNCIPVLVEDHGRIGEANMKNNEMQVMRGNMLDVVTISNRKEINEIDETLAAILCSDLTPDGMPTGVSSLSSTHAVFKEVVPSTDAAPQKPAPDSAVGMTKEAFLSQKAAVLLKGEGKERLEQSQVSILQNYGVHTVAAFLEQTEESFSAMKSKNGVCYKDRYLEVQALMKEKLESL